MFKLAPVSGGKWKESTLYSFTGGKDGANLFDGVILDSSGNLYGTAAYGGRSGCNGAYQGCGVVFKLTPVSGGKWKESTLYSFTGGKDGGNPYGGLIFDVVGNLYGTTGSGGVGGYGTVFKLAPVSGGRWKESTLQSFTGGKDGAFPEGLIFDAAGNLYGATGGQDWLVFKLTRTSGHKWRETVIHHFALGGPSYSVGHLIFDATGNLYGMTNFGGAHSYGTVYKLTPMSDGRWKASVIHAFGKFKDGAGPTGSLVFDAAGNLYGTTGSGGVHENGAVFKLMPTTGGGWKESLLYSFTVGNDGGAPEGGVILDNAGNLYGTTFRGGAHSVGVVFELTR
ncbi:MAG TPA: choice-of-anchor tandem repeat GloVer-containing protein [Terriglobales bacterium]|nr:choice-of-anchor tandem repeat GloVer-containing protein [Terriglobales bacterium]